MTAPKRDARAALATGGLLLIPLAALWLLLAPAHRPRPDGGTEQQQESPQGPPQGYGREGLSNGITRPGQPGPGDAPTGPGWPAPPGPPTLPPPRVAAGAPTQAGWTLLGLTLSARNGFPTPPVPLPGWTGAGGRDPFLQSEAGAVGLWIGVRGGVGLKTLRIPQDGLRHAYPLGRFSLVCLPQTASGDAAGVVRTTLQWQQAGAAPGPGTNRGEIVSQGSDVTYQGVQAPYRMSASMALAPPGHPAIETVTLTPAPFSDGFRVTALPLSASGRPTGKAVRLLCQPVTASALFAQIPAGYGPATRRFRVTVARAGVRAGGQAASWLIGGLPPAVPDGEGNAPAPASARVGPFTLRAVAAEAEDTSGETDPANQRPARPGGSYSQNIPYSQNMDRHQWTGLPTLHYLLLARAAAPPPPGQSWLFRLDRVAPQWGAMPPPPDPIPGGVIRMTHADGPLGVLPLTAPAARPAPREWLLQDGEVGAAWPGQPNRVTIRGTAIRQASRTETVTFHDADVVWDAGFGGDRIVWRHPETETTASGIAVTVLNGRPGKRDTNAPPTSGQDWWYDRGNAEILLAWRLPPGLVSGQRAALSAPRVALPPTGAFVPGGGPPRAGALLASWDDARPDPYAHTTFVPGGPDVRALARDGYAPLRLAVWMAGTPKRTLLAHPAFSPPAVPPGQTAPLPTLPHYSWRDGPFVLSAAPLPRHLPALTLRITTREEQERRPIHLVAPVSAALPTGTGGAHP